MKLDPDDPTLLRQTSNVAGNLVERMARQAADLEASRGVDSAIQSDGLEAIAGVIDAARSLQALAAQAASPKDQEPS